MSRSEERYPIGSIVGDFKVISHERVPASNIGGRLVLNCQCQICGHYKSINSTMINTRPSLISHDNCKLKSHDRNGMSKGEYRRFYDIWKHMVQRCTDPKTKCYDIYGGRNITTEYTDDQKGYLGFFEDMYPSYIEHVKQYGEKDTTLDRINSNGNYVLENIRWATCREQAQNRRSMYLFIAIDPNGQMYMSNNVARFCEEFGLERTNANSCINGSKYRSKVQGWRFYKAYPDKLFVFDYSIYNIIYKLY